MHAERPPPFLTQMGSYTTHTAQNSRYFKESTYHSATTEVCVALGAQKTRQQHTAPESEIYHTFPHFAHKF